jgi:hypothetical protein
MARRKKYTDPLDEILNQKYDPKRRKIRHARPYNFASEGQGRQWCLVRERLCKLAKIVASYSYKSGECWASTETLAWKFGMSRRQTARYLGMLSQGFRDDPLHREGLEIIIREGLKHKHGPRIRTVNTSNLRPAPSVTTAVTTSRYTPDKLRINPEDGTPTKREDGIPTPAKMALKFIKKNHRTTDDAVPALPNCPVGASSPSKENLKDKTLKARRSSQVHSSIKVGSTVKAKHAPANWAGFSIFWTGITDLPVPTEKWATHFPKRFASLDSLYGLAKIIRALREFWEQRKEANRKRKWAKDEFALRDFLYDRCEDFCEVFKINAMSEEEQRQYWENRRLQRGAA